jgi:hypothetical protein
VEGVAVGEKRCFRRTSAPVGIGEEVLESLGRAAGNRRGDGAAILAGHVGQQARPIAFQAGPTLRPLEERRERLQGGCQRR